MNKDQVLSAIRTVLKILGSVLIAHGAQKAGNLVNSEDVIGLVITIAGIWWSWKHHSVANDSTPAPPAAKVGLWLLIIGMSGALFLGCKAPQQRVAFNTLYSLEQGVTAAIDGYDSAVIKGTVRTNDVPRVSALYNKFQASFIVALDAVRYNTNAIAPPNLVIEAQDVVNLITTLKGNK